MNNIWTILIHFTNDLSLQLQCYVLYLQKANSPIISYIVFLVDNVRKAQTQPGRMT